MRLDPSESPATRKGVTADTRRASLSPGSYDAKARTVKAVLSAGAAVKRFYGTEVLKISSDAVDLSRLTTCGVPLLDSHQLLGIQNVLGRLDRAWFEKGKLLGQFSFDDSEAGRAAEGLVARGVIKAVSIGYSVAQWTVTDDEGNVVDPERERLMFDGDYTFTAARWQLQEASLVTVPADQDALIRSHHPQAYRRTTAERRELKEIIARMRVRQTMMMRHSAFVGR